VYGATIAVALVTPSRRAYDGGMGMERVTPYAGLAACVVLVAGLFVRSGGFRDG
jgi:hypothetical protein